MRPGQLRHFIELQAYNGALFEQDVHDGWYKVTDMYCEVTSTSGSENLDKTEGYSLTDWNVLTRFSSLVTMNTKQRFLYKSRYLYIEAINPDPTGCHSMNVSCNEINP